MAKASTLFIGHGSPMNAITRNDFTECLRELGSSLARPQAILVVSAHWETDGTWVTGMDKPRTIHDFYGFPQTLFDVEYPTPGTPKFAQELAAQISEPKIEIDRDQWGLDHGAWSVLKHMFPNADVPVFQLSLDRKQPLEFHFELGKKIKFLREQGVMIMGSGNIVHNLSKVIWTEGAEPYDWAIEFDEWVKQKLSERNFQALVTEPLQTLAGKLSIPTREHYLPLLYTLGASDAQEKLCFEYEGIQMGSMSMRCLSFGKNPQV